MQGGATANAVRAPLVSFAVLALSALGLLVPHAFELTRPEIQNGQLWRLLTGHLTHYSGFHFAVDAGTFLVLGWIVEVQIGSGRWLGLLTASALAISVAFLVFEPGLDVYRGLSGLDCTAFAAALILEFRRYPRAATALGLGFAAKLVYEQIRGGFLFPSAGLGDMGLPVLSAHTVGAATGLGLALMSRRAARGSKPAEEIRRR